MSENSLSPPKVNHVYARDRAAVAASAVLAVVQDALSDPELVAHLANTLRDEFADIVREVFAERFPPSEGISDDS